MHWKERARGWTLIKQNVCSYYLRRKVVFGKSISLWCLVSRLFVILFIVWNVKRWAHRCCCDILRQVSLLLFWDAFVCRTCLGHSCSAEEKLQFKRGEGILEKVEKFSDLDGMTTFCGVASEAVGARIGSAWKKFMELSDVVVGDYLWSNKGRLISVVLDQFCCTVVKCGNLLLWLWEVAWVGVSYDQNDVWGDTGW